MQKGIIRDFIRQDDLRNDWSPVVVQGCRSVVFNPGGGLSLISIIKRKKYLMSLKMSTIF
jgi:hypothetical protein